MKYTALIFDMDGTLVHNMPFHNQALQDALAKAGVQIQMEPDEFYRFIYGKKTEEVLRALLGPQASDAEIAYLCERKEVLYRKRFACCREPLPGLLHLLEQARAQGILMAVASAAPPDNIPFILDELDLRRYFTVVVNGHEVQQGKPHPEIFLKAARTLDVEPASCLVFEDALSGIEAARRAGMDAVMLCTTIDAQEVAGQSHVLCAVPDFTHLDLPALLGQPTNN
jgi:beta-phosphoglucomutase family hydrolase